MSKTEKDRIYEFKTVPFEVDQSEYLPPYTPEKFTKEELSFLQPFFSNVDRPIFISRNLPPEIEGALASRYSRSTQGLRRLFLTEYVGPIIHPETQKDWMNKTDKEKEQELSLASRFKQVVRFFNRTGGIDDVVNVQRARQFFDRWLTGYGDDSIAEEGGVHLFIEGMSSLFLEELVNKRVGISPLVKSTRYVSFFDKRPDEQFQYILPGELEGTEFKENYKQAMDGLFQTYSDLAQPYLDYIMELYPKGEDETDVSFRNSRAAKRFDDLRDLLPFATQNNVALYGNGRAFEDLVNRLILHPLGEFRAWGQAMVKELETTVPSFIKRPTTIRGAEIQAYRRNINTLRNELSEKITSGLKDIKKPKGWVKLVEYTPEPEIMVLSTYLFAGRRDLPLSSKMDLVKKLSKGKRQNYLNQILEERKLGKDEVKREEARFKKVPRAFENAHFLFELWLRGGDYRDLHRHRQMTEEHAAFSTKWKYDLEKEILGSPFAKRVIDALKRAAEVSEKIAQISPELAQYAVPFGYLQHTYMNLTAREIYWMVELRTGPQGRPHYREVCQQIALAAKKVGPTLFSGLMVDMNKYGLARRESEKKIDKKRQQLK